MCGAHSKELSLLERYKCCMTTHFAGTDITTNALRAELIARSETGDKKSADLLQAIAKAKEPDAGQLVTRFRLDAGSATMETAMAGLGLVSFGLVLGILGLIVNGMVMADLETLFILLSAFAVGQWGLFTYSKMSTARYHAQELQKLASIMKVSDLVKQQYAEAKAVSDTTASRHTSLSLAYGSVA